MPIFPKVLNFFFMFMLAIASNAAAAENFESRARVLNHIQTFDVRGKVAYKQGSKGGSATIHWQQKGAAYDIALFGPLSSHTVYITGSPQGVKLRDSEGKVRYANNAETLVLETLNLKLPVSGLRYWLLGIPQPGGGEAEASFDAENHLRTLRQQGWTIHYESYNTIQGIDLPQKLSLIRGNVRLKFVLKHWSL